MDDRLDKPSDSPDRPPKIVGTDHVLAAETPAEQLHEALERIRLNPPLKGFTTDEFMRLIRDDL